MANLCDAPFLDADQLHSQVARAKMAAGVPLTDDDRWPWLERVKSVAKQAQEHKGQLNGPCIIIACSALRRAYRDVLRSIHDVRTVFVYLRLDPPLLMHRLAKRTDHFMKSDMLASQLDTLEEPINDDEVADVLTLEIHPSMQVEDVMRELREKLLVNMNIIIGTCDSTLASRKVVDS